MRRALFASSILMALACDVWLQPCKQRYHRLRQLYHDHCARLHHDPIAAGGWAICVRAQRQRP